MIILNDGYCTQFNFEQKNPKQEGLAPLIFNFLEPLESVNLRTGWYHDYAISIN